MLIWSGVGSVVGYLARDLLYLVDLQAMVALRSIDVICRICFDMLNKVFFPVEFWVIRYLWPILFSLVI